MPDATATRPAISVQLYSVFEALQKDRDATFQTLAEIGLTTVEAFDFVADPVGLASALHRHGLTAATGHAMFLSDTNEQLTILPLEATLEAAATVGIEYLLDPFIEPSRWTSRDEIERTAERMNAAAEVARGFGIGLGYHNHGHEFVPRFDGRTAHALFAELTDPSTSFEIDLYWAQVGGVDPVALVAELGERVVAVHVKDGDLAGVDPLALVVPDGQTAAGDGAVPLAAAIAAAPALRFAVIEFDRYPGDIFDGVAASVAFLKAQGL